MLFQTVCIGFVAATFALPTNTILSTGCESNPQPVTLTKAGWSLPLTHYTDSRFCVYSFKVPDNYFAYVNLDASDLSYAEQVIIKDMVSVSVKNDPSLQGLNSFSSSQSWPDDFSFSIQTNVGSKAWLAVNITLLPENPISNIVKSYITYAGSASVFIDAKDWKEGESYKFTSKDAHVYITVASLNSASTNDAHQWNNVFVYEKGVFQQTLAEAAQIGGSQSPYVSFTNEVILYMSKKVGTTGAAMITDKSNVKPGDHYAEYVPKVPGQFSYQFKTNYLISGLTLVSYRNSPTNITIQTLHNTSGNGVFSFNGGGPNFHKDAVTQPLTSVQLPYVVAGYANTFYLSKGLGEIAFNV